jgi:spore maturation protein SpmB
MKARKFQRFEVVVGSETIKTFSKNSEAEAVAYAKSLSMTTARSVAVDAVSQNGSTGQRTTCVAVFVSGTKV